MSLALITLINLIPLFLCSNFPVWSRYGGGNHNDNGTPVRGSVLNNTNYVVSSASCEYSTSSPAVADGNGNIYFGDCSGFIVMVNSNGNLVWEYGIGAAFIGQPTLNMDQTVIYITGSIGNAGYIYSVGIGPNAAEIIWDVGMSAISTSSPALSVDETEVIVTTTGGTVLCYDAISGALVWTFSAGGGSFPNSPAVDADGTIYAGSTNYNLYALNSNGVSKWIYPTAGQIVSAPTIDTDGTVYFGSMDFNLYAVNSTGQLKWKLNVESVTGSFDYCGVGIAIYNGKIIFGTFSGSIVSANSTGSIVWTYSTDYAESFTQGLAVDAVGRIYVASTKSNTLYSITPSGVLKFKYVNTNIQSFTSYPCITAEGSIVVGDGKTTLVAIGEHPSQYAFYMPTYRPVDAPSKSPTVATYNFIMSCTQVVNGISLSTYLSSPTYSQVLADAISRQIPGTTSYNIKITSSYSTGLTYSSVLYSSQNAIEVAYTVSVSPSFYSYSTLSTALEVGVETGQFDNDLGYYSYLYGTYGFINCISKSVTITNGNPNSSSSDESFSQTPGFIALMVILFVLVLPLAALIIIFRRDINERIQDLRYDRKRPVEIEAIQLGRNRTEFVPTDLENDTYLPSHNRVSNPMYRS